MQRKVALKVPSMKRKSCSQLSCGLSACQEVALTGHVSSWSSRHPDPSYGFCFNYPYPNQQEPAERFARRSHVRVTSKCLRYSPARYHECGQCLRTAFLDERVDCSQYPCGKEGVPSKSPPENRLSIGKLFAGGNDEAGNRG